MSKTKWSTDTLFSRPGAKKGCSFCKKKFEEKEVFYVRETKTSWFRGDDEVEFICLKCRGDMIMAKTLENPFVYEGGEQ